MGDDQASKASKAAPPLRIECASLFGRRVKPSQKPVLTSAHAGQMWVVGVVVVVVVVIVIVKAKLSDHVCDSLEVLCWYWFDIVMSVEHFFIQQIRICQDPPIKNWVKDTVYQNTHQ